MKTYNALFLTTALALTLTVAACGDSSPNNPGCTPGSTQKCNCVGGAEGVQACNAAGNGYNECFCGGTDGGVDTTVDGLPGDTTVDSPTFSDTTVDSSLDGGGGDTTRDGGGGGDTTRDGGGGGDTTRDTGALVDSTVDSGTQDFGPDSTPGGVALHGDCSTQNCATGLICVTYDSAQPPVCYQDCTTNAGVCASNSDGRTTCFAINSTTSTCVNQIATNGQCNLAVSKICGTAGDGCTGGTCSPLPRAGRFGQCAGTTGNVCDPATQVCVNVSSGLTHGFCFDQCTPTTPTCTTNGQAGSCVSLATSGGACVPNGTSAQDTVCGQDEGQNWSAAKQCGANLVCLTFTQGAIKGLCLPTVTNCTTGTCAGGRSCVPLTSGSGACAEDCTAAATTCTNNGKNCSQLSATQSVCTPAGSQTFAQICSASNLCAPNLTCLSETAQSPTGFCTQACGTGTPCPNTPAGASCFSANSLCVFDCSAGGSTCPTGLTCTAIAGTSLCLP